MNDVGSCSMTRIPTFILTCAAAATTAWGGVSASLWPSLWDRSYVAGESAALLHEEVAPGIWTVFLHDVTLGQGRLEEAGVLQVTERSDEITAQQIDLVVRTDGKPLLVELEITTSVIAGELYGADDAAAVSGLATTIRYEAIGQEGIEQFVVRHLDLLDVHADPVSAADVVMRLGAAEPAGCADAVDLFKVSRPAALMIDPDVLQLCVEAGAPCTHKNATSGLDLMCCISSVLESRTDAFIDAAAAFDDALTACEAAPSRSE